MTTYTLKWNNGCGTVDGGSGDDTLHTGFTDCVNAAYGDMGNDLIDISVNRTELIDGGAGQDTNSTIGETDEVLGGSGNDKIVIGYLRLFCW